MLQCENCFKKWTYLVLARNLSIGVRVTVQQRKSENLELAIFRFISLFVYICVNTKNYLTLLVHKYDLLIQISFSHLSKNTNI